MQFLEDVLTQIVFTQKFSLKTDESKHATSDVEVKIAHVNLECDFHIVMITPFIIGCTKLHFLN